MFLYNYIVIARSIITKLILDSNLAGIYALAFAYTSVFLSGARTLELLDICSIVSPDVKLYNTVL